jgi:hypothetical protein
MSETQKDRILADLKQAKQEGTLRVEKIRDIVKNAVSQTSKEFEGGRGEIRNLVRDAIAAVVEVFQEKGGEIKEEITASLEGVIEGVSSVKRQEIAKNQNEVKQLEAKIETARQELQDEIDTVLEEVKTSDSQSSAKVKEAIAAAIETIKNSEEAALLQKRYAQLKAQLALVQANLAGRYGEQFEDVNHYVEEAKKWYDKAKQNPEVFTGKVEAKRVEFEAKLGEAGSAIAKKEKEIKTILQELWKSLTEIFKENKEN